MNGINGYLNQNSDWQTEVDTEKMHLFSSRDFIIMQLCTLATDMGEGGE